MYCALSLDEPAAIEVHAVAAVCPSHPSHLPKILVARRLRVSRSFAFEYSARQKSEAGASKVDI